MGEFDGVGQQVGEDLAQTQRVAHQGSVFAQQCGVADIKQQLHVLFVRVLAQQCQRITRHVFQAKAALLQFKFASFNFGKIQDVVDDGQQRLASGVDFGDVIVLARIQVALQCQVGHADDGVHGRADFVAHVGQEH